MLDEEQQQAMGPEFLAFLDEVAAIAAGQTEQGIEDVEEDQAAIRNEVASQLMQTAAELQAEAAENFNAGVDRFIDAVNRSGNAGFGFNNFGDVREVIP